MPTSPRDLTRRVAELEQRADAGKVPIDVVVVYTCATTGEQHEGYRRTVLVDPAWLRTRDADAARWQAAGLAGTGDDPPTPD